MTLLATVPVILKSSSSSSLDGVRVIGCLGLHEEGDSLTFLFIAFPRHSVPDSSNNCFGMSPRLLRTGGLVRVGVENELREGLGVVHFFSVGVICALLLPSVGCLSTDSSTVLLEGVSWLEI